MSTKPKTKTVKKIMSEDQLAEMGAAESSLDAYREYVANLKSNVREATRDAREAQANLKNEKNQLAKAEKDAAVAKKKLAKLKVKYKGWAKPKTDSGYANVLPSDETPGDLNIAEGT